MLGQVLENRIAKAAVEGDMAGAGQLPGEQMLTLYRRWAAGRTGLLITGNVMVRAQALTAPVGLLLDDRSPLKLFADWVKAAKSGGGAVWMQINHPGPPGRLRHAGCRAGDRAARALGVDLGELSGDSYMVPVIWSDKALASAAGMARVRHQTRRLARGRDTRFTISPAFALLPERHKQSPCPAWLSRLAEDDAADGAQMSHASGRPRPRTSREVPGEGGLRNAASTGPSVAGAATAYRSKLVCPCGGHGRGDHVQRMPTIFMTLSAPVRRPAQVSGVMPLGG
ncbi:hypothetical protein ACF1E9_31330 [Streptomyces roseolus]|uniref:hypothetical protein n=1 Tax=Streptomyces roseolus TaxID=67358 RepID=UPI0036F6C66C